ncbi:hypothetical protein [Phenylobacterium sp.]|jgi:hypothetical protein|uniref:hypothetical protein n=1 Tax=Phenylobacterium sp. TaxID=1871053 RepID=UPI002F42A393
MASRRAERRRRALGVGVSLAAHLAILAVLLTARQPAPPPAALPPIEVALVGPTPEPDSGAPPAAAPAKAEPKPPPTPVRPTPPRPDLKPIPAAPRPEPDPMPQLTEAQIASAATAGAGSGEGEGAGAGSGGRPCDMVRRVQAALRKDPRVRAAVAEAEAVRGAPGKALYVWNGDWIRSRGQDGAGLAAAREAIMWEVAFAPETCRAQPVHGLVLFSMGDTSGSGLVVGGGTWRWSDLLRPRASG